jgi:hypothetical protein
MVEAVVRDNILSEIVKKVKDNYGFGAYLTQCVFISRDLAVLIGKQFPEFEVFTAIGHKMKRPYTTSHHQVTVVQEPTEVYSLDLTAPIYKQGEITKLRADSTPGMLTELHRHYGGTWELNAKYFPESQHLRRLKDGQWSTEKPIPLSVRITT